MRTIKYRGEKKYLLVWYLLKVTDDKAGDRTETKGKNQAMG